MDYFNEVEFDDAEYMAELDGIEDCGVHYYSRFADLAELIEWVKEDLEYLGGGHADIYDEDGNFVEDVEV